MNLSRFKKICEKHDLLKYKIDQSLMSINSIELTLKDESMTSVRDIWKNTILPQLDILKIPSIEFDSCYNSWEDYKQTCLNKINCKEVFIFGNSTFSRQVYTIKDIRRGEKIYRYKGVETFIPYMFNNKNIYNFVCDIIENDKEEAFRLYYYFTFVLRESFANYEWERKERIFRNIAIGGGIILTGIIASAAIVLWI